VKGWAASRETRPIHDGMNSIKRKDEARIITHTLMRRATFEEGSRECALYGICFGFGLALEASDVFSIRKVFKKIRCPILL
jgi:hypothetical protein